MGCVNRSKKQIDDLCSWFTNDVKTVSLRKTNKQVNLTHLTSQMLLLTKKGWDLKNNKDS